MVCKRDSAGKYCMELFMDVEGADMTGSNICSECGFLILLSASTVYTRQCARWVILHVFNACKSEEVTCDADGDKYCFDDAPLSALMDSSTCVMSSSTCTAECKDDLKVLKSVGCCAGSFSSASTEVANMAKLCTISLPDPCESPPTPPPMLSRSCIPT
eukprot:761956-Hanusia_phi.AAC.1